MTTVVERVQHGARQLDPVTVVLTPIAWVFFVVGWVAAQVVRAVWAVVSWALTAVVLGWKSAHGEAD
ncbi:hypothetical protein [Herbidospora daliensis]|uniref:hypothetical protein n=1 Tax=Herbidospora daliensis TaxID=295585 RepID=UPI000A65E37D|nr:hypothetical protein [Herbidospora daliensis]